MRAEIISIGTEILLGHIVNTNTSYISRVLARLGIDVFYHNTIGDNTARLREALYRALDRSDIIITTGGLGPTVDDITLETLAAVARKELVFHKDILKDIEKNFKKRGFKMPKEAVRQAFVPKGARALKNTVGTAPGLIIEKGDNIIIALPGPPRELEPMVKRFVASYLKRKQPHRITIKSRALKLTGLPESQVNAKVKDLLKLSGALTVGIYAHVCEVDLKITCKEMDIEKANQKIRKIEKDLRARFGDYIYGADEETLQSVIGKLLTKKKKTLAVAESCSGGYISNLITNVSHSSKYFKAGVVAYSNKAKAEVLGVSKDIIKDNSAVSKETAKAMADNIRSLAKTDFGIGVTGIAGPTGGTKAKPVGTVFVAVSGKKGTQVKRFGFIGTREEIKLQTAQQALNLLRLNLLQK